MEIKGLKSSEIKTINKRLKILKLSSLQKVWLIVFLFELKDYDPNSTLLCATNGQITKSHKEFLLILKKCKNAKIVLGYDNDEKDLILL